MEITIAINSKCKNKEFIRMRTFKLNMIKHIRWPRVTIRSPYNVRGNYCHSWLMKGAIVKLIQLLLFLKM